MSSYRDKAINPKTGATEEAWFLDDYFGRHRYGVQFDGEEHVYRITEVMTPRRERALSDAPEKGSE